MNVIDKDTKNLVQVGMFSPIDLVFLGLITTTGLIAGYQATFASVVNPFKILMALMTCFVFAHAWTVVLVLRGINFVIRTHAKLEVMTDSIANRAVEKLQAASMASEVKSKASNG